MAGANGPRRARRACAAWIEKEQPAATRSPKTACHAGALEERAQAFLARRCRETSATNSCMALVTSLSRCETIASLRFSGHPATATTHSVLARSSSSTA